MSGFNVENIKAITRGVCNVNIIDNSGYSPLHLLVQQKGDSEKDLETLKLLLSAGADVNVKNKQDKTPLYLAVNADRSKEIIEALLSAGADVNAKDKEDETPLYLAVNTDRSIEIIEALLSAGADVNAKDKQDKTPLYLAVNADRSKEIIEVLLSAGADVNAKDKEDKTPLYLAVNADRSIEIIEVLLSAGADVNAKDEEDETPLYLAVKADRSKEIIEALIDGGADLELIYTDELSGVNGTILLHAIIPKAINKDYDTGSYQFKDFKFNYIDAEITKLLINKAARIESACENTPGCSPLLAAALFCRTDLVKLMLKHISIKDANLDNVLSNSVLGKFPGHRFMDFPPYGTAGWRISGFTALHLSIFHSDLEMAAALIEAGADRNIQDDYGKAPLHHAVTDGKHEFVELLVKRCVENSEESKQKMMKVQSI